MYDRYESGGFKFVVSFLIDDRNEGWESKKKKNGKKASTRSIIHFFLSLSVSLSNKNEDSSVQRFLHLQEVKFDEGLAVVSGREGNGFAGGHKPNPLIPSKDIFSQIDDVNDRVGASQGSAVRQGVVEELGSDPFALDLRVDGEEPWE